MSEFAIMPYEDYKSACDVIREKTGKTETIKSGDLATEIGLIGSSGQDIMAFNIRLPNLPKACLEGGCAVVYNNELHVLGMSSSDSLYGSNHKDKLKYHYKWNAVDGWVLVGTLPFNLSNYTGTYSHQAIVYNNQIHFIGIYDDGGLVSEHYVYNGTSWTSKSKITAPSSYMATGDDMLFKAIVFKDELYVFILKSVTELSQYKWDSSSSAWVHITDIAIRTIGSSNGPSVPALVIFNDELYVFPGYRSYNSYYNDMFKSSDGSTWTQVAVPGTPTGGSSDTQSSVFSYNCAVEAGGVLHMFGYGYYTYDGISAKEKAAFNSKVEYCFAKDGKVYAMVGGVIKEVSSGTVQDVCTPITTASDSSPFYRIPSPAIVISYQGNIHLLGGTWGQSLQNYNYPECLHHMVLGVSDMVYLLPTIDSCSM